MNTNGNPNIIKRDTKVVSRKYYLFRIGSLHLGWCEAKTDRGVRLIAATRRSALDKHDPKKMKEVLDGRIMAVLKLYRRGKSVRNQIAWAGLIPVNSSNVQSNKITRTDAVEVLRGRKRR